MFVTPKKLVLRRGYNRCSGEVRLFRVYAPDSAGAYRFCYEHDIQFVPHAELIVPFAGRIYHGTEWCDPAKSPFDCMFNPDFPGCPHFCCEEW